MSTVISLQESADSHVSGVFLPVVAVAMVTLFFSNVLVYGVLLVYQQVKPIEIATACVALLSPLYMLGRGIPLIEKSAFTSVLLALVAVNLFWLVGQGGGDADVVARRVVYLFFMTFIFTLHVFAPQAIPWSRRAVLWLVLFAVVLNVYDITHPFVLVPRGSEFSNIGRAAGLYVNANQAGAALVLGYILTVSLVTERRRWLYTAVVTCGVLLTLSRAAIAGIALTTLTLTLTGVLRPRDIFKTVALVVTAVVATWSVLVSLVGAEFGIDISSAAGRLLWFLDPASHADYSQIERERVVARAWGLIQQSPWIGNGAGSTETWTDVGTHNMYLMMMADFGVWAIIALPTIALAAAWRAGGESRRLAPAFAVFTCFWGLFSHNILGEYYFLIALSLFAAMTFAERRRTASRARPGIIGETA